MTAHDDAIEAAEDIRAALTGVHAMRREDALTALGKVAAELRNRAAIIRAGRDTVMLLDPRGYETEVDDVMRDILDATTAIAATADALSGAMTMTARTTAATESKEIAR